MSYLNALRLHFAGRFQANLSTVNNGPGHFDNAIFKPRYQDMQGPGMVLPNDDIQVKLQHVGMVAGRKLIKVEASNKETEDKVLLGEAEIEQPVTAYVFTGQGSQEQGMGMEDTGSVCAVPVPTPSLGIISIGWERPAPAAPTPSPTARTRRTSTASRSRSARWRARAS